jgi:hypothetical protein
MEKKKKNKKMGRGQTTTDSGGDIWALGEPPGTNMTLHISTDVGIPIQYQVLKGVWIR